MIKEIKGTGPQIESIIKRTEADEITGIKARLIKSGKMNVTIEDTKSKKAIGFDTDVIG